MIMVRSCTDSPCSTSKRSRKNQNKNPYSSQGLDKFSALLSELEEKRQKIYSEAGRSQEISLVRFAFNGSNEIVPILVKTPETRRSSQLVRDKEAKAHAKEKKVLKIQVPKQSEPEKKKCCCLANVKLCGLKRSPYIFPLSIILVLTFLVVFNRSVAIMCTCIGWYAVPMINDGRKVMKPGRKKKEYMRRLSNESKAGSSGSTSPRSPDHGKPW